MLTIYTEDQYRDYRRKIEQMHLATPGDPGKPYVQHTPESDQFHYLFAATQEYLQWKANPAK